MGGCAATDLSAESRCSSTPPPTVRGTGRSGAHGALGVPRDRAELRYFHESSADVDELLGAVYDRVSAEPAQVVEAAMVTTEMSVRARTRAGTAAVLQLSSTDPRRGRVLSTDAGRIRC